MGVRELADRGRQETWRRIGRTWARPAWPPVAESGRIASAATLRDVLARLRGAAVQEEVRGTSPRFYEGAVSDLTPALIAERLPAWRERVQVRAEDLLRGRFDLLGYRQLRFGDPPDWRLDPVSGQRTPLVHWSWLDPLDAARVGDSKVVWEVNRHQWLTQLGHAYRLTGDERYARAAARHVTDWMRANPPGLGINWASSLEVALRLIAWCWTLALVGQSPSLATELGIRMLAAIWVHARHVERHLSSYFSPNTHLTGEALGLFYAGVLFPELHRASSWRALATRILVAESRRQVLPDGVYFEQSTCYQRYSVEIYLHFLILARRNRLAVPPSVESQVQRMLDFLLAVRQPDGAMPRIGDADGGWLLPLVPRGPDDTRGVFSTAAALFGRPDFAWAARGIAPETLWLLGPPGVTAFEALRPAPPKGAVSSVFPDGGYVVMRSGFDAEAHHLIFDTGPLGCPVTGGHGHADLLALQCSAFGEPFLVDPGTGSYCANEEWRDFFRSTAAHSTALVDGEGQAIPAGPFGWHGRPRARLRRTVATEQVVLAEADHTAYGRLPDPVVHRRRVLFVGTRYWVVVDEFEGTGEHRVDIQFQFAPLDVTVEPQGWIRARGRRGPGLLLRAFAAAPLTVERREGGQTPRGGWVSPAYGRHVPAPLVVHTAVATMPVRIATLLFPVRTPECAPPQVTLVLDTRDAPVELVVGNERERVALC